jgi:hypothetical protein
MDARMPFMRPGAIWSVESRGSRRFRRGWHTGKIVTLLEGDLDCHGGLLKDSHLDTGKRKIYTDFLNWTTMRNAMVAHGFAGTSSFLDGRMANGVV